MIESPTAEPPRVAGLSGLTVLARGGYATVFRAIQDSVDREVAIKIENRTLETERDQRRFLREARASGRMSSHPHVVDLIDVGVTQDGHPYLIMELCRGSYADRMKLGPLEAREVRDVGVKIADALVDSHALGVLHRDVKPANILYTRFGEPALADFGLAILSEFRDVSITLDVLTPAYAPPEMFKSGTQPTGAVDVYGLASSLYAMLRGFPARWPSDRTPTVTTLMEMFEQPIPDLWAVPKDFTATLRAAMANDPTSRPSAARFRDSLSALVIPDGRPAPPPGFASRRGPADMTEQPDPTQRHSHDEMDSGPAVPDRRASSGSVSRSDGSTEERESPTRTRLFSVGAALLARLAGRAH